MVGMFRAGYLALILLLMSTAAHADTGILVDRLSPKHRKTWEAIKQIIVSERADGTALHPTLRNLFEQLQSSNHAIYLEFEDTESGCRCIAGQFVIERLDPINGRNVGVIKLYLRTIDHTNMRASSKGKFIPLAGLKNLDRYAEVFGHEMAHGVDILFNQGRAMLVDDMLTKTKRVLEQRVQSKNKKIGPEAQSVLEECDTLLNELEKPAAIAEEQIWRELTQAPPK